MSFFSGNNTLLCNIGTQYEPLNQLETGSFNYMYQFGTNPGFIFTGNNSTQMVTNNFGSVFEGVVLLKEFYIQQLSEAQRVRPKTIEFFDGSNSIIKTLSNTQSLQYVVFDSPIWCSSGWIAIRIIDTYPGVGGNDVNFGLTSYGFIGKLSQTMINNNIGILPTIVGGLTGYTRPSQLVDNIAYSNEGAGEVGTDLTNSYFSRKNAIDSITINYSSSKTINILGIGFSTGPIFSQRVTPKFINVIGLNASNQIINTQQINVYQNLQFARYTLNNFIGIRSLKIEFPNGTNNNDWYLRQDNTNYGISEFQAIT